jgi:hypothetical protein
MEVSMAKRKLREFLAALDNAAEVELAITKALEEQGCKILIDDKDNRYVPKNRLDAKIAELAEANEEIESLQKQVKDPTEAEKQVKALEEKIAGMEEAAKKEKLSTAINKELAEAKPKDVNDLMKFLDMEKVVLKDDGTVEGLTDQLAALQKDKAYLFDSAEPQPQPGKSFLNLGSPGKPSNLNAFGSKTTHEGDFGALLGKQCSEQAQQVDSNYFFGNNDK